MSTTDDDPETAWIGALSKDRDQNWIGWQLPRRTRIRLICIRDGFTRDYNTYAGNGRIREGTISKCGKPTAVAFHDHVDLGRRVTDGNWRDFISIPVDCSSDRVHLRIDSTYPAYDGSRVASVSDVRFYESWHLAAQ
jgi:hypothetical protein